MNKSTKSPILISGKRHSKLYQPHLVKSFNISITDSQIPTVCRHLISNTGILILITCLQGIPFSRMVDIAVIFVLTSLQDSLMRCGKKNCSAWLLIFYSF